MASDREEKLSGIFDLLCGTFERILKDGEKVVLKDGLVVLQDPSAATLREARQLLADNGINADVTKNPALQGLAGAVLPFPISTKK